MKNQLKAILLLVFLLVVAGGASAAFAQDDGGAEPPPDGGITDDEVNVVAEQLYCPVCENIPLDVCGTKACSDWRAEIRQMLADGKSEAEIMQYFVDSYGRRVLATPDATGFYATVWALPIAGVLIGVFVLVNALRRMAPGSLAAEGELDQSALTYADLDPDYVERLEAELKEFIGST